MEYTEKIKQRIILLTQQTSTFNEKFTQVVGDKDNRGLWVAINEQHQLAIRDLRIKRDKESLDRLNTIVSRERKVLESCENGMKFYIRTLDGVSDELAKFFKVKSIAKILWYIRYTALLLDNIKKVQDRIEMEQKEIITMLTENFAMGSITAVRIVATIPNSIKTAPPAAVPRPG